MKSAKIEALREEYSSLVIVANGLVGIVRSRGVCNVLTMARMAEEARAAARSIASLIERLLTPPAPVPTKQPESFLTRAIRKVGEILMDIGKGLTTWRA